MQADLQTGRKKLLSLGMRHGGDSGMWVPGLKPCLAQSRSPPPGNPQLSGYPENKVCNCTGEVWGPCAQFPLSVLEKV